MILPWRISAKQPMDIFELAWSGLNKLGIENEGKTYKCQIKWQ